MPRPRYALIGTGLNNTLGAWMEFRYGDCV
jgi:hypothetical protein